MLRRKVLVFGVMSFLVLLGSSCGYRFSPGGEHIDPVIKRVYVDNFSNRTSEAELEVIFRNAFLDQFRRSTRFRLAESRDQADAVLRGGMNSISTGHLSYTRADIATEERLTVVMDVSFEANPELVERGKPVIIWKDPGFSGYRDYRVSQGNPFVTDQNRRAALQLLAEDMAQRAFRALMSGF
ncbi:MAG: LptE family protein [Syntrophales bacterium]|nr:LptE family protein [Syntrophales bacterium]